MIVHVSDRRMRGRARMINQLCVTHNKKLLQALLVEDQAWIGPLVRSDANGCWECAWRRLQANLSTMQGHNEPSAKPLDMLGIVPLELPMLGGIGRDVRFSSFHRSF